MKKISVYMSLLLIPLCMFTSCENDDDLGVDDAKVTVQSIKIVNGGISKSEVYDGTIYEENKMISFAVAAETDLSNITFEAQLPEGSKLEKTSYNFSKTFVQKIRVINGTIIREYIVTLMIQDPLITINSIKVVNGGRSRAEIYDGIVDQTSKTITFSVAAETDLSKIKFEAELPEFAKLEYNTYNFSKNLTQKIRAVNAHAVGIYTVTLTLKDSVQIGIDFSNPTIYDYSLNPIGNSIFPDFAALNTRSADFDGSYILMVSRDGGNNPKLLSLENVVAGNTTPIMLSTTGISGGTFAVSSGRLAQKHIYISNLSILSTATERFKIYHWADPTAEPELICSISGAELGLNASSGASVPRFGDNLSVNLDASGNGYIFALNNTGSMILRLAVSGFTTITETSLLPLLIVTPYYGSVSQVGSSDEYILSNTYSNSKIGIIDKNGVDDYRLLGTSVPIGAGDARVVTFNGARYLIATTGRWTATVTPQTFLVYDITNGSTLREAFVLLDTENPAPVYSFSLNGTGSAAASASTGWAAVGDDVYFFAAAPQAGFTLIKFPKKK